MNEGLRIIKELVSNRIKVLIDAIGEYIYDHDYYKPEIHREFNNSLDRIVIRKSEENNEYLLIVSLYDSTRAEENIKFIVLDTEADKKLLRALLELLRILKTMLLEENENILEIYIRLEIPNVMLKYGITIKSYKELKTTRLEIYNKDLPEGLI